MATPGRSNGLAGRTAGRKTTHGRVGRSSRTYKGYAYIDNGISGAFRGSGPARSDTLVIRAARLTREPLFLYFAPRWVARTAGHARPMQRDLIRDVEYIEFIADADGRAAAR